MPSPSVNRLIAGLPARERGRLLQGCRTAPLVAGTLLCDSGTILDQLYFPTSGWISLATVPRGHPPLQLALVGSEGVVGASILLGVDTLPVRATVGAEGSAVCMSPAWLRQELPRCPVTERRLGHYLYSAFAHLARGVACARFHAIEPRLASWLLAAHDRAGPGAFHLTHETLADDLGVRRSGVTIAAGSLHDKGLILYRRGDIRVLDRRGLEAAACGCHAMDASEATARRAAR